MFNEKEGELFEYGMQCEYSIYSVDYFQQYIRVINGFT
jgi:hypothetical protein